MTPTGADVPATPNAGTCRLPIALAALIIGAALAALLAACAKETPEGLIRAAERHLAERNYRAAQIELKNAIRLAPNSGAGYRLLGTALLNGGEAVAAEVALRQALSLAESPDEVLPALAQALLRQGQSNRLTEEFGTRRLENPANDAALQTSLGQAWLMLGDVRRAEDSFAAALARVARHPLARLGQAQVAAHGGRIDVASAMVDEVLAAEPRLAEAHVLKARLALSQGQRGAAVASLDNAIAVDAGDVAVRVALVALRIGEREYDAAQGLLDAVNSPLAGDPRVVYLRGLLALRRGDLQRARDEVNRILQRMPDHVPALTLSGEIELQSNNLGLAEGALQRALRVSPDAAAARRLLATTSLRQGRPARTIDLLQPLLQRPGPPDAPLAMLVGEAYLASGDAPRAAEFFESAKSQDAHSATARLRLGQIALVRGDFDRGVGELQAASAADTEQHQADLLLVALHLRRYEPEKALAAAEAFLKKQPDDPLAHVLVGTASLAGKDLKRARLGFDAALKIRADYLPALRGLADVDLAEGRPGDARQRYESLLARKPADEHLLVALAGLQERTGKVAEAGATLRNAVMVNRRATAAHVAVVQYHLRQHDPMAAMAAARAAVAEDPAQPLLLELLGNTQEATGSGDDAVKTFQELARLQPQSPAPLLRLAAIQAAHRDFNGAARSLRQAQLAAPVDAQIARELVDVYVAAGKFDDALEVAKARQDRPLDAALGYALEGEVHATRRKWPEAERAWRSALKAEPESTAFAISLCRVLTASGRAREGAALAKNWLVRHPADVPMRMHVAQSALDANDYPAAARQYEAALSLAPNHPQALNNLAWTLGRLNDARAMGLAERAAALAPDSAPVLDTLGMLLVERGEPVRAMAYLARVRSLAPDRKDLRVHYAIGLMRTGRMDEGKAELQQLFSTPDDFPGKADIPMLLGKR